MGEGGRGINRGAERDGSWKRERGRDRRIGDKQRTGGEGVFSLI